MFDNPSRELKRLEERLLAAEKTGTEEDPEQALADAKRILAKDEWSDSKRVPLSQNYVAQKRLEQDENQQKLALKKAKQRRSNSGGLAAALLLELAALCGVIVWWKLWK